MKLKVCITRREESQEALNGYAGIEIPALLNFFTYGFLGKQINGLLKKESK